MAVIQLIEFSNSRDFFLSFKKFQETSMKLINKESAKALSMFWLPQEPKNQDAVWGNITF